jgi:hypothetical protein
VEIKFKNMINQNFVIICESAIIEKDTNNLYFLGVFENISSPITPARQPRFAVVTNFKGGIGEHNHKIVVRYESGDEIAKLEGKINFGSNQKAQYIGKFIGFSFPKFGKYNIEIYVDEILQPLKGELNVVEKSGYEL